MSSSQNSSGSRSLHPVSIGDKINGTYEIRAVHSDVWDSFLRYFSRKDGGFVTYLARDSSSKYVCLQIFGAASSVDPSLQAELELLDRLVTSGGDAARDVLHVPTDKFWIEGPSGRHQCLVYDLYGPDLAHLQWPINMVGRLAKDSLQALEYLHGEGICHANLYPSSFVVYPNVDPRDEAKVLDLFGLSGSEEDPYDKAVLALNETGTAKDGRPNTEPLRIKLRDFRRAFTTDKSPMNTTPLILARECPPPELAFGKPVGLPMDIWYLATRIGQLAAGKVYYGYFLCEDDYGNETLPERLRFAETVLGEMPPELQAQLDTTAKRPHSGPESFQAYLRNVPDDDINKNERISEDDYRELERLLRRMLAWEAKDRITAKEALRMPFFR